MSKPSFVARMAVMLAALVQRGPAQVLTEPKLEHTAPESARIRLPGSPFGIAWGFLYGYSGTKTETFMPAVRAAGAGVTKVYLFWNQIEPEKGRFQWDAVDAFLNQLNSPEEGLIALFSTSTWAVQRPGTMLPPSPAKSLDDYYQFVHALVSHAKGRVRYWQNDSEPNSPVYWAGTKEDFVQELKVFYKAVKDADPSAVVVAGAYDGLFNPPGTHPMPGQEKGLDFFNYVLKEGANSYDLFDLHLYADPYSIPWRVGYIRGRMQAYGYEKPIIGAEYNGPGFYEFPANWKYAPLVMKWLKAVAAGFANGEPTAQDAGQAEVAELYARMDKLDPQTQMFMQGCSTQLEEKFGRIQARDLVMRNVLALSAGVQKMLYWAWHRDSPKRDDVMNLMYGKLTGCQDCAPGRGCHFLEAYKRMAKALEGVEAVTRRTVPDHPAIFLFEVRRRGRGPLDIVWEKRDVFSGEDAPATAVDFEWNSQSAVATDTTGQRTPVKIADGRIRLNVSVTPVFIEGDDR